MVRKCKCKDMTSLSQSHNNHINYTHQCWLCAAEGFLSYWGIKAWGNVKVTMKRNQNMVISLSTLILRNRIPNTPHNAKGTPPLHHTSGIWNVVDKHVNQDVYLDHFYIFRNMWNHWLANVILCTCMNL